MPSPALFAFVVMVSWLAPPHAQAWIHPEHRLIGVEAWKRLSPEARRLYEVLWQRARFGYAEGLCEAPVAPEPGEHRPCLDLAAWPALAGDHSCSPKDLIDEVLPSAWARDVARVSVDVQHGLEEASNQESRDNVWIVSNLRMQEVDSAYVTRAGANNAHFLLPQTDDELEAFIAASTQRGAELNALGLYVQYHAAALELARGLGADLTTAPSGLVRRILALEAYALHFLQDMFASGHVAGTWGEVALRKGTHDYYCEHGYSTTSWKGDTLVMYGDAHMRAADLARASIVIARSMMQVADAARTGARRAGAGSRAAHAAFELDSCKLLLQPEPLPLDDETRRAIEAVVIDTAKPGRGPESAAWPRYRADFGEFLGVESSVGTGLVIEGYGGTAVRAAAELGIGVVLGYALEGVVASVNTGTMFVHLGITRQSEQTDLCAEDCGDGLGSATLPRVPSRAGVVLGLRMPFWLVPGDLLLLAPILALTSPEDLTRVAIRAASGGLIPWQRTFSTAAGHVELVAGRVVYASFYGLQMRTRAFAYDPELTSVGFRSVELTFPAIEWTPFRAFAQTLTSQMSVQIAYAVDLPFDIVRYPEQTAGPDWSPAHMVMLRIALSGRGYL